MPLEQVKPGEYERPLDSLEKLHTTFAAIGAPFQKEHWLVGSVIRLNIAPAVDDVKQAWKALRLLHPRIAVVVDETGTRSRYAVATSENLEQWLQETFILHPQNELNAASAETLHRLLPPSPLFQLHYLPSSRELLFRAPHWRADGAGMTMLQGAYLSILASSAEDLIFHGSDLSRLPPTLDEVLCPAFEVTEDVKQKSAAEFSVIFDGGPNVAVFNDVLPNKVPGDTYRTCREFSKDDTAQIVATIKQRGLTVTAAVQAALLLTASSRMTPTQEGRLVFLTVFDVRKYLPSPWNGPKGAAGLFHTGRFCGFHLEDGRDFASISEILRSHYARDIRYLFSFLPYFAQQLTGMLSAPVEVANEAPGAAHTALVSYGTVDDDLRTRYDGSRYILEVEDWWQGLHAINNVLAVFCWTRDDQLHISCHYNEAFYTHEFVEQFIEEWKSTIADELVRS